MGITNYIYRKAYSSIFQCFDIAFIPFINKGNMEKRNTALKKEISNENNINLTAVVQVLTNNPGDLLTIANNVFSVGEKVVNWNLGCPFPRVVNKKRGAGFLPYIDEIRFFLDKVMPQIPIELSIKTRLGIDSPDNILKLINVFNEYPIKEIIIHPRTVKQKYDGIVDLDAFGECLEISKNEIVYNGDIFSISDFLKLKKRFPIVKKWMIGRGALKNPILPEKIKNGSYDEKLNNNDFKRIKHFHDMLLSDYKKVLSGEKHLLDKMKEVMSYLTCILKEPGKSFKKIIKTQCLSEYAVTLNRLFEEEIC